MLNEKIINICVNAKSNKFLCKTMSRKILSLYNNKEALLQATRLTLYGNCYLIIHSCLDICYLVKLLTMKTVFYKQLKRGNGRSYLPNLFINDNILLARGILLTKYINSSPNN